MKEDSAIIATLALFGLMCFLLLMAAAIWLIVEWWLDRPTFDRCSCGNLWLPSHGPTHRVVKNGIVHEPARCQPQREEML